MAPFAWVAKRATQARGEGPVVAADISETGLKDTAEKAGASARRLTTVRVDIADEASWACSTCSSTPPASCAPPTPTNRASPKVRVDGGAHF